MSDEGVEEVGRLFMACKRTRIGEHVSCPASLVTQFCTDRPFPDTRRFDVRLRYTWAPIVSAPWIAGLGRLDMPCKVHC